MFMNYHYPLQLCYTFQTGWRLPACERHI